MEHQRGYGLSFLVGIGTGIAFTHVFPVVPGLAEIYLQGSIEHVLPLTDANSRILVIAHHLRHGTSHTAHTTMLHVALLVGFLRTKKIEGSILPPGGAQQRFHAFGHLLCGSGKNGQRHCYQ